MERKLSENYKARTIKRFDYLPWMAELADYYVSVVDLPIYRQYIDMNQKLGEGLEVIPNRDAHKDLLIEMGHDAAVIALPRPSFFQKLVVQRRVCSDTYLCLHQTCMSRLMVDCPTPLGREGIIRLHGLLDRLLFGIAEFDTITEVPTIGPWFWEAIGSIRSCPRLFATSVALLREYKARESIGGKVCRFVAGAEACSLDFLSAASAVRHGRKRAIPEDVRDAAIALTKIFYVDITQLDPPRRVQAPEINVRRR